MVLGRGQHLGCVAVNSASSFGGSRATVICRGYKSGPIASNSLQLPFIPLWIFQKKHLWSTTLSVMEVGSGGHRFAFFFSLCLVASKEAFLWLLEYLSHRWSLATEKELNLSTSGIFSSWEFAQHFFFFKRKASSSRQKLGDLKWDGRKGMSVVYRFDYYD